MGYTRFSLYARSGYGGDFHRLPDNDEGVSVYIGMDDTWKVVMEAYLHETIELSMTVNGARFVPAQSITISEDKYFFWCNHPDFSNIISCVADEFWETINDLHKVWEEWNEKEGIVDSV